jgi:NCAIR mutase (PurE)-related protein
MTMQPDDLRQLLEHVRKGSLSLDAALAQLTPTVADLGFAHVDLQRRDRCGFPEVIFCEGKACAWVEGVVRKLVEAGQDCLATRINDEQAAALAQAFPHAQQNRVARTFWLPAKPPATPVGQVIVITAGTSDLPVAQEAVVTAQALGAGTSLLADVGVAGIHRPVIAVPTSVGYGAAFGGLAPLLTMLNSCAANVVVVNIDSGFKAGYVAALIARRRANQG